MNFVISKEFHNFTIEEYLQAFNLGKTYRYKLQITNSIYLNNNLAHLKMKIYQGDNLVILFENIDKVSHEAVFKKINILYEDDHFLLVEKEENLLIHSDGTKKNSLSNYVQGYYSKTNIYPRALHRLDYPVTGFVLFSKHLLAHSALEALFSQHKINKEYTCLCFGKLGKNKGEISLPLSKSRHDKKQITTKTGKDAKTLYEVLSYDNNISRLKVNIIGGRKHQIRAHLASIGHPINGDELYGSPVKGPLMLAFTKIEFIHPFTKQLFSYTKKPSW